MDLVINPKVSSNELLQLTSAAGALSLAADVNALRKALRKSYVVAAYDQNQLVGLVRAVSDNVRVACVVDLLLAPLQGGASATAALRDRLLRHVVGHFAKLPVVVFVADAANNLTAAEQLGLKPVTAAQLQQGQPIN